MTKSSKLEDARRAGGQVGNVSVPQKKRVFVAMSGGVDSSVAALLLKKKGYDATGVFMRCYNLDGCAERDSEDARRVAERIGIPFYAWDFEEEYKKRVVDYMVDGYRRGLTPNPDVMCNKEIKFGLFFRKARSMGADYVATGHYVRLSREFSSSNLQFANKRKFLKNSGVVNSLKIENYQLKIAKDLDKDQSYFLWTLTQDQLKYCLFPIGDYPKSEVRNIARKAGLPTADKKDSQGICFLGKVTLLDFLKGYIPEKRGEVFSVSGERIGMHRGAQFYTIGQRHIGVGARSRAPGIKKNFAPFYVAEKNVKANTLTVAEGNDHPALYKKEIKLTGVNLVRELGMMNNDLRKQVFARVRYRQPLAPATLAIRNLSYKLVFDRPQKFVAPGQSAVLYRKTGSAGKSGYRMIGGGIIS